MLLHCCVMKVYSEKERLGVKWIKVFQFITVLYGNGSLPLPLNLFDIIFTFFKHGNHNMHDRRRNKIGYRNILRGEFKIY